MKRALTTVVIVAVLLAGLGITQAAAWEFYMTITGAATGPFPGETGPAGWSGTIPCLAMSGDLQVPSVPTAAAGGAAAMPLTYTPLTITKPWGAASPRILEALVRGENLTQVMLKFTRTPPTGAEEVYYTITLTNARIVGIHLRNSDPATAAPGQPAAAEIEEVSFLYDALTIEYMPTGAQASTGPTGAPASAGATGDTGQPSAKPTVQRVPRIRPLGQ